MAKQDDYIKTALRLPRELHQRIQESADSKGRSMNAEIIDRLSNAGDGVDVVELKARLGIAEGYNRERMLTIIRQFLDYLSSPNRSAEAERDLLIFLVRKQSELIDQLGDKHQLVFTSEDIDQ